MRRERGDELAGQHLLILVGIGHRVEIKHAGQLARQPCGAGGTSRRAGCARHRVQRGLIHGHHGTGERGQVLRAHHRPDRQPLSQQRADLAWANRLYTASSLMPKRGKCHRPSTLRRRQIARWDDAPVSTRTSSPAHKGSAGRMRVHPAPGVGSGSSSASRFCRNASILPTRAVGGSTVGMAGSLSAGALLPYVHHNQLQRLSKDVPGVLDRSRLGGESTGPAA